MLIKPKKKYTILDVVWMFAMVKQAKKDDGVSADGTADNSLKRLEVSRDIDMEDPKLLTYEYSRLFWHEFLHACFFEMGADDFEHWDIDFEHALINPMSKIFAKNFPLDINTNSKL